MGLSNRDKNTIKAIAAEEVRKGNADSTPIGPTPQELEDLVTTIVAKAVDSMFDGEESEVIDTPAVEVITAGDGLPAIRINEVPTLDVPVVEPLAPGGQGVIDTPTVAADTLPEVPDLDPLPPLNGEV